MINNIELNHLKYFYFTVVEGGVTQAANRLCVQQPVVSRMLKNLEDSLEEPLFWKNGRSKSLTDYGQLVFRHCQVVFSEVDKIKQIANDPATATGVFNLGGSEPIVNYIYPQVFSELMKTFPNLNFNVYTSTQSELLQMISTGKLDLGCFFYAPNLSSELEVTKAIPVRHYLVIKKSLAKNKKIIQSFIGSREIDDVSTHSFPTVELMRKQYPETRITFSCNSLTLHRDLVLQGKGVSILPEFMVEKELASGQLVDIYPKRQFKWDLMVIKRKADYLGVVANRFIQSLAQTFK